MGSAVCLRGGNCSLVGFAALLCRKRPSPSCCSVTGDSLVFTLDSLGLLPLDSIIFKGCFNLKNSVIQLVGHWLSLKKPILRGL